MGPFANKDGDRIDAISAPPTAFSSYVFSNNKWFGVGKLDSAI